MEDDKIHNILFFTDIEQIPGAIWEPSGVDHQGWDGSCFSADAYVVRSQAVRLTVDG